MQGLPNLVAVYGVLDEVVAASRELGASAPEVLDPTLHDVTPGWYQQFQGAVPTDVPEPDLAAALTAIAGDAESGTPLSLPQKVTLFSLLTELARFSPVARDTTAMPDFLAPEADDTLVNALAALGPDGESFGDRVDRAREAAPELFRMAQSIDTVEGKLLLKNYAVERGLLPPQAVYVKETRTFCATVDGHECVVIDTECGTPDIPLDDLLKVVNPYNWHDNYPVFFRAMAGAGPPGADGWPRVLETVALAGGDMLKITTPLRYHTHQGSSSARLDFDLAVPAPPGGDGKVPVDRGWINMWAHNADKSSSQPGVRVRTKKVVHVDFYIPQIQRVLVGPLGYGPMSAEFLFGNAVSPPADSWPFDYRGPDGGSPSPDSARTSKTAPTTGRHFAPTAVQIWTDAVKGLASDYSDVAGKWLNGGLSVDEFADYAATTSDRVIRAPFDYLQAMTRPRVPDRARGTTPRSES